MPAPSGVYTTTMDNLLWSTLSYARYSGSYSSRYISADKTTKLKCIGVEAAHNRVEKHGLAENQKVFHT